MTDPYMPHASSTKCPLCAGPLTLDGRGPRCPEHVSHSAELVAKAEALFASYLAARIVHARRVAKTARIELLRNPRDRDKAQALRQAEQEVERLQAQLVVQTRASEQARRLADQSRTGTTSSGSTAAAERACPRCGSQMPGAVNQCRCGYTVETSSNAFPADVVTADEFGTLRDPRKRG